MIITRPKTIEEILTMLEKFAPSTICVVGCGICARKIQTGGETQVTSQVDELRSHGLDVLDGKMIKHACSATSWDELSEEAPALAQASALLVLSCGAGVSLLGRISGKPVLPGLDTTSIGGALGDDISEGLCSMCGECDVAIYAGLCPKSGCPKSQVNGPCGGSSDGDCEVGGRKCIWARIFETLDSRGLLALLDDTRPPVCHDRRL
ncbi:MAG: methylenetetrahydrofolate reductase C-terminal domain-containing protein [ANME-2 cluster archaeon]|nr:methylenetetrahydrofolate reductase C-terminal domain-containing protein [ANME-2 cluster archaeon]MDF1532182.1 methylenetetrahydrofolate reductase C-terminal domain-containing protein [ANME-2 cluster archaeon]